ncbi:hypothetical protein HBE96_05460 [Clostridium sp. P21]|uniref:SH3b domain-containing protein n=1 Tax=Clostridium muellerianum TaxID=2716538 RepID=A0A7Y0EEY0_9CLOT|nr:hypothetical protein [Clostridium muellerianum]NMM62143.1 hypothetical protein [Clostridium muellerianum]
MLFLLFVLAAGGILFMLYHFTNEISNQRKQILLLKQQNNNLIKKIELNKVSGTAVEYIKPNFTEAFITNTCNLYIHPIDNSIILNSIPKNTNIKILCSAKIEDKLWYEISIIDNRNVNTKGWVKSEFINPNNK